MNPRNADYQSPESSSHLEEIQWVRRVREESDRKAFENIFRCYHQELQGFAFRYCKHSGCSEDIVQTVFLRIWAQKETWHFPCTLKKYLYTAVRNEALNVLRRKKVESNAEEEVIQLYQDYNERSDNELPDQEKDDIGELRKSVQRGVDNLPPRCRQIFLLNRQSGLTYLEIADYLEISVNTVTTQMGRALKALRKELDRPSRRF